MTLGTAPLDATVTFERVVSVEKAGIKTVGYQIEVKEHYANYCQLFFMKSL